MATFSGSDLKRRRNALNMTAADLAERVSCDTSTIFKIESGKVNANPDLMYEIAEALNDIGIWGDWMRTAYPTSYGRFHPMTPGYQLTGALMALDAHTASLMGLMQEGKLDVADGQFDDMALKGRMRSAVERVVGAGQQFLIEVDKREGVDGQGRAG